MRFNSVYLDYAATTPVDDGVVEKMLGCMGREGVFANPSSSVHQFGAAADSVIKNARNTIADCLSCSASEIVFTSGATESDNLAIVGLAHAAKSGHIITVATEHKAVLAACDAIEVMGFSVTRIRPNDTGVVDPEDVLREMRDDTKLVSVMHVNNETGVIQDINAIGNALADTNAIFHVDAAQSAGKMPIDLAILPVDLMSISGHKIYGPKGIGVLFVRKGARNRIEPIMYGGGQEGGLRSGTLATHQIVGFAEALSIAARSMMEEGDRIRQLSDAFLKAVEEAGDVILNGDGGHKLPNIINVSFGGVDAEALMANLPDLGISSTSACTSGALEPSHVLRAMGIEGQRLYGAVRFSFGRFTTRDEVDYAATRIITEVKKLREMAED